MAEEDCGLCMFPECSWLAPSSVFEKNWAAIPNHLVFEINYVNIQNSLFIPREWLLDTPSLILMSNKSVFHDEKSSSAALQRSLLSLNSWHTVDQVTQCIYSMSTDDMSKGG